MKRYDIKDKDEFKIKIKNAETLAQESWEVSYQYDIFRIEQQKINRDHYLKLLSKYFIDTIRSFNNTDNIYKNLYDHFQFFNNEYNLNLKDEERIDYIASIFQKYLYEIENYLSKNSVCWRSLEEIEDLIIQLKNIENIIYETKLLQIKTNKIKEEIEALEINSNKNEFNQNPAKNEDSEKHSNIFRSNGFAIWQYLFTEGFEITSEKRSDVKFIFEEMKKDELIYNTVSQKHFLNWITETYNGLIIGKTSNHSRTNTRKTIYNNAKEIYKIKGT